MGIQQPSRLTPLSPEAATKAMADGYQLVTGKKPSKEVLSLMTGQWALETGNGQYMHNFNFGNKKASGNDDYQYFRCSEIIDGREVFFDPPHPACKFASYDNPAEGAASYVKTLKSRAHWWNGLHTKTVEGFIKGLTTPPAYFTANPVLYGSVLENRMNHFQPYAIKYAGSGPGLFSTILFALGVWWTWKNRDFLSDKVGQFYSKVKSRV